MSQWERLPNETPATARANLIWALILGWIVFGELPSWLTILGATVVCATGLFTLYRERVTRRPA